MSEAVIVAAEISAGHDGRAELVIRVRHENGVVSNIVLDGDTGLRLLEDVAGDDLDALAGRSWGAVLEQTLIR